MVISLGLATQLNAAEKEDVIGDYTVSSKTIFKAKKLGKDVDTGNDPFSLNGDDTFSLGPVSGLWSLDSKGKKILLEINAPSLGFLADEWAIAISNLVLDKFDVFVDPDDITVVLQKPKISPIKIDKKTNKPKGKFKVTIKGTASAFVPGEGTQQTKISFKGKFTIGEPAEDGGTTAIDWVGTPRVEHSGLAKKFYQSFVVSGPSGNVRITATCKNSSGSILDELTKGFPVEAGEEYEITVDATVLGLGRSPSPDSDDVFFSSSSASSSRESSIGDCTLTFDDVIKAWYYLCATDYSITDMNIQLVP